MPVRNDYSGDPYQTDTPEATAKVWNGTSWETITSSDPRWTGASLIVNGRGYEPATEEHFVSLAPYGITPIRLPDGQLAIRREQAQQIADVSNRPSGLVGRFLDAGGGVYGLAGLLGASALGGFGAGGELAGLGEPIGANAYFAGAPASSAALPASYWNMLAGAAPETATDVTAGTLGTGAGEFSLGGAGAGAGLGGQSYGLGLQAPSVAGGAGFNLGTGASEFGLGGGATGLGLGGNAVASTGGTIAGPAMGTALSRILAGNAAPGDWLSVLGTAGATGLGMFSANRQANTLQDLLDRTRADRAPFLSKANEWLANPEAYLTGPGASAMKGTLSGLSARFGNPIGSPTALAISNEAGLRDWRNAVTGMANLGLGGEDVRAQLGITGTGVREGALTTLAGGVSEILNPKPSLADLLRQIYGRGTVGSLT